MRRDQRRRATQPDRRTPRAVARPPARRRRGGDPGDDRAARHRGGDRAPRGRRARRGPHARTTSTPRSTTTRSVVKQLAMRRTLFVFPRDLLPAAWGSASARVATSERKRIAKAIAAAGIADGRRGVARRRPRGDPRAARRRSGHHRRAPRRGARAGRDDRRRHRQDLRPADPGGAVGAHPPRAGGRRAARSQRRALAAEQADLDPRRGLAGQPCPSRSTRPRATPSSYAAGWPRSAPAPPPTSSGGSARPRPRSPARSPTSRRWRSRSTTARPGWVLPDDTEDIGPVEPWAALLPTLDPTVMGWKSRAFYLDPAHVPYLFDTNGNAGTTAWWDGRVVGCWVQDDAGVVRLSLLEDVGAGGPRGPGARGGAAHRVARRHRDRQRLRLAPDEAGQAALGVDDRRRAARTRTPSRRPRAPRRPSCRRAPRRCGDRWPGRCRRPRRSCRGGPAGAKTRSRWSAGTPRPRSRTSTRWRPSSSREPTSISGCSPSSVNFAALSIRFISTERSWAASPRTTGSAPTTTDRGDDPAGEVVERGRELGAEVDEVVARRCALRGEGEQVADHAVHPVHARAGPGPACRAGRGRSRRARAPPARARPRSAGS